MSTDGCAQFAKRECRVPPGQPQHQNRAAIAVTVAERFPCTLNELFERVNKMDAVPIALADRLVVHPAGKDLLPPARPHDPQRPRHALIVFFPQTPSDGVNP